MRVQEKKKIASEFVFLRVVLRRSKLEVYLQSGYGIPEANSVDLRKVTGKIHINQG